MSGPIAVQGTNEGPTKYHGKGRLLEAGVGVGVEINTGHHKSHEKAGGDREKTPKGRYIRNKKRGIPS